MKISAIFIGVICYGLGIATSYTFFRNREKARADEEIKAVKERLLRKEEERINAGKKKEEPVKHTYEKSSINSGEREYQRTNYATSYIDPATKESPKEEDDDADDKEPHEISMEEYMALTGVEKRSLMYYTDNNVLRVTDSTPDDITPYEFIDDEHNIVGDVLEKSGFKKDDYMEMIYIYNPVISAAYEVTKCYGKYDF